MDACRNGKHRLAGKPYEFCGQLFASRRCRRRSYRSLSFEQCKCIRPLAAETYMDNRFCCELHDDQECRPRNVSVKFGGADDFWKYFSPTPDKRAFQYGVWVYPLTPELQ